MSMQYIYSLKDELTGFKDFRLISADSQDESEKIVIRDFADICQTSPLIQRNYEDFNLYFLGMFNNKNGCFLIENEPVLFARASQFYRKDEDKENG